jgi:hypothetical protein
VLFILAGLNLLKVTAVSSNRCRSNGIQFLSVVGWTIVTGTSTALSPYGGKMFRP